MRRQGGGMRARQWVAAGLVAGAFALTALGGVGAADVTYTPNTISYGTHSTLKVTGLTPMALYTVQIYNPWGVPLLQGGGIRFPADASGTITTTDLDPDQTDLPGTYLFEVQSSDNKVVARTTPTLVGRNTYYVQKRLNS